MAAWPAGWSGRDPSVLVPGADAKDAMSAALATTPTTGAAASPDVSTLAGRVALVKSVGEECQTDAELEKLLEKKAGAFRLGASGSTIISVCSVLASRSGSSSKATSGGSAKADGASGLPYSTSAPPAYVMFRLAIGTNEPITSGITSAY